MVSGKTRSQLDRLSPRPRFDDNNKARQNSMGSSLSRVASWTATNSALRRRFRVANPLGQVLLDAASVYEALSIYRDRVVLERYLFSDPPLHPRRTLDQAYFRTLKTTKVRDRDQVVHRGTRRAEKNSVRLPGSTSSWAGQANEASDGGVLSRNNVHGDSAVVGAGSRPSLLMVDQIWMWILDENTIVTSCPEVRDREGVHKSICGRLGAAMPPAVSSVYDLGLVVLDQCFNSIFSRSVGAGTVRFLLLTGRKSRAFDLTDRWGRARR